MDVTEDWHLTQTVIPTFIEKEADILWTYMKETLDKDNSRRKVGCREKTEGCTVNVGPEDGGPRKNKS